MDICAQIHSNKWRLEKNGQQFADNIFEWIFLIENLYIFIEISLKYVSEGIIDIMSSMV